MPVMSTTWEKQTLGRLVRDAVVQECRKHQIYGGNVEIDGIICISGKVEGQELVIKLHERVGFESRLDFGDFMTRPRDGWTSILNSSRSREDDAEDYSIKRRRLDEILQKSHEADSYPNLKQHLMTPSHARDLREIEDLRNRESAKDLSMSSSALDMTPPSPSKSEASFDTPTVSPTTEVQNRSSHSPSFGNRYIFTSTPYNNSRHIPMRYARWSPSQPTPNIPECKPCGVTFNSYDELSDHNEAVHSVFTCQSCFKTFTSRSNLERHSRLHTGHRPYGCTICGKTFSRKDHLSNHATKHAFKCGTCSKRFTDKKMLVTHYSFDHNAILTNICDYCNKGFASHEMYDEHLKAHPQCGGGSQHSPSPKPEDDDMPQNLSMSSNASTSSTSPIKHICKTCNFATADRLTLLKHQVIHAENNRCYTCLSCSKMFEDPLHYSDHLMMHSTESNIFECCLCRQICPTLTSLRRHESTHLTTSMHDDDDLKPTLGGTYGCPKCQKTFDSEYILADHMQSHNASDGFVCSVCDEEFQNYSEICSHIEREGHYAYSQPVHNGTDVGPKNKRKQKLPKAVKHMDIDQESDVEVVEPESPDDLPNGENLSLSGPAGFLTRTSTGEFLVTDNPAPIIEITPESPNTSPVKRIMSHSNRGKEKPETMDTYERLNAIESALSTVSRVNPSPQKSARSMDKASTSTKANETNNNVLLSPKLMNVEIPEGPYTCSICSNTIATFPELEMHCFSEHNRSPCMFCNKTFAQKANRDRHVCLHTGEKPYSCPDCNEKFSRGDKLKIHRMRAHQTSFPPVPPRGGNSIHLRDGSVSPNTSPSESRDSTAYAVKTDPGEEWTNHSNDNIYGAGEFVMAGGEWSIKDSTAKGNQRQFVAAGGEWNIKEDSEVPEGVDDTVTADDDE